MHNRFIIGQLALVLGLTATSVIADGIAATPYDLSWYTIDGGGGSSTGAAFVLSGTSGQADAGITMSGGAFSISGGFWPGSSSVPLCPADINGDHSVNVNDLLAVITNWGTCPLPCPPRCAADVAPLASGDCAVNVNDLLLVITSWGACP